jgi:hypothetical protein
VARGLQQLEAQKGERGGLQQLDEPVDLVWLVFGWIELAEGLKFEGKQTTSHL